MSGEGSLPINKVLRSLLPNYYYVYKFSDFSILKINKGLVPTRRSCVDSFNTKLLSTIFQSSNLPLATLNGSAVLLLSVTV